MFSNCLVDEDEDEDKQDLLRELIQLILDSSSSIIDHLLTEIQVYNIEFTDLTADIMSGIHK